MTLLRSWLSVALAAVLLTVQTGCASPQVRPIELPPSAPPLTSISAWGRTGVSASWGTSQPRIAEPPKGWTSGLARGAAGGAGVTVASGVVVGAVPFALTKGRGGGPELVWLLGWTAVGVALAPVGAMMGGIVGAVKAQPPAQVERAKVSLVDAMTAADLPAIIRDEVIRIGGEQSWHTLVPLTDQESEAAKQEVGTALEIVIRHVGLEGKTDPRTGKPASVWLAPDPELELRLDVDASLTKVSDSTVVYTRSFREVGAVKKFSVWAADDGRAFRDGLRSASERVADQIAQALFPAPPPPAETKEAEAKAEPAPPLEPGP